MWHCPAFSYHGNLVPHFCIFSRSAWSPLTYPFPFVIYNAFTDATLRCTVTLTTNLWYWTIVVYRLWHCHTLCETLAKSDYARPSYSDLNIENLGSCPPPFWISWYVDFNHNAFSVAHSASTYKIAFINNDVLKSSFYPVTVHFQLRILNVNINWYYPLFF